MPVSGLVVSLSDQHDARENAIELIRQESRIEIGVIHSQRMAVVMDTASSDEDKELWNWLDSLQGVVFVDVAMVGFEAADGTEAKPLVPSQCRSMSETNTSRNRD